MQAKINIAKLIKLIHINYIILRVLNWSEPEINKGDQPIILHSPKILKIKEQSAPANF